RLRIRRRRRSQRRAQRPFRRARIVRAREAHPRQTANRKPRGLGHRREAQRGDEKAIVSDVKQSTVLVADDHPMMRDGITSSVLRQPDMQLVGEAGTGQEALELFRQHRPDITLMDLQMPVMNGLDAIMAIRAEFPAARIIVLTTYKGDVQATRAMQ